MLPSMRNIRLAVCFLCTLGIALCPNFSPCWHIMKKHWRNRFSEMGDKNACRTPQARGKKRAQLVCRSSMTSGNTELHLGCAILETVFLNLNYMKQWQDLRVMMLRKQRPFCSFHELSGLPFQYSDLLPSLWQTVRALRFYWTPFQTGHFGTNFNFC